MANNDLSDLFGEEPVEGDAEYESEESAEYSEFSRYVGNLPIVEQGTDLDEAVGGGPVVLPEPTIINAPKRRVRRDEPRPTNEGQAPETDVMERMRAGAAAAGVQVSRSAQVEEANSSWERTLDYYMTVLQRAQRELDVEDERVKFMLTTDPVQEQHDRMRIISMLRSAFLERDAGHGEAVFMQIVDYVYNEVVGLSVLAPLWNDPDITEILVDGWENVYYEQSGTLFESSIKFRSVDHLKNVARNMAEAVSDRSLTKSTPLVTARLPGARVAFAFGDIAGDKQVYIAIRKHHNVLTVDDLLENDTLDAAMLDFLKRCVEARVNILISGGTGAGKTTVINAVSSFIPSDERVITIEDSYELELRNNYWVKLQSKVKSSADDQVEVTVSDLLKQTLRMRPDRIVVGEVRDGHAAAALLEAANTGHDGTLTTLHANGAWDAINERLPGLYRQDTNVPVDVARSAAARAFELVVHVARRRGRRFISEIAEVGDIDRLTGDTVLRTLWKTQVRNGEVLRKQLALPMLDGDLAQKFDDAGMHLDTGNILGGSSPVHQESLNAGGPNVPPSPNPSMISNHVSAADDETYPVASDPDDAAAREDTEPHRTDDTEGGAVRDDTELEQGWVDVHDTDTTRNEREI